MIGTKILDVPSPTNTSYGNVTQRQFSSYVLDGFGGGPGGGGGNGGLPGNWPVTKANTIFNIVPQGYKFVVERFGKLHSVKESGFFFAIPLVDQIAYVIDVRERAIDIVPQAAITRDNVSVEVSGNLFVKFQDPEKAAYGALNPLYSVTQVNATKVKTHLLLRLGGPLFATCLNMFSKPVFTNRACSHCHTRNDSCSLRTHNLPCDLPSVKWSSTRFCTIDLV
jgi:hypothetical protein